mmetsp:Transcript_53854/g.114407  ORF Transcript_53854/g.114407 Transcript_53854/m.114407 type:complete len:205 (-) Transcript_53854:129-743(-)
MGDGSSASSLRRPRRRRDDGPRRPFRVALRRKEGAGAGSRGGGPAVHDPRKDMRFSRSRGGFGLHRRRRRNRVRAAGEREGERPRRARSGAARRLERLRARRREGKRRGGRRRSGHDHLRGLRVQRRVRRVPEPNDSPPVETGRQRRGRPSRFQGGVGYVRKANEGGGIRRDRHPDCCGGRPWRFCLFRRRGEGLSVGAVERQY